MWPSVGHCHEAFVSGLDEALWLAELFDSRQARVVAVSRRFDDPRLYDPGRKLSPHFMLGEFTKSHVAKKCGLPNIPKEEHVLANLKALCIHVLEPVRLLLKAPLKVTSGYRCQTLNRLVGGSASSQHVLGEAADIVPQGMDVEEAALLLSAQSDLPFDQLIYECRLREGKAPIRWLHISHKRLGGNCQQCLTIFMAGGKRTVEQGIKPLDHFIS